MFNLGTNNIGTLYLGRKLDAYTGVTIHTGMNSNGNEVVYSAGDSSGYVLEVNNPLGTQEMAYAILAGLKLRSVRYQPFDADGTLIDPAAEIGDGVTANGTKAIIMSLNTDHSHLLAADVSAPMDDEVDHEFHFEPRSVREFKRESAYTRSRLTITQDEIRAEVVRATGSEATLSAALSVQADRITSEVARATGSETTLSSRITQTVDAIVSEVTRATGAEGQLSTQIAQRLDSITLSVTSASGSSTFAIKDGSTTLDTKTLNLTVKAANISGKLTVGQLADGSVVISSKTETEYYLSTSASSATGGSWATTVPTWASGKYIWTRQKTTDTFNDNTASVTYSPSQNGAYDKNLTGALSTASSASSAAATAQSTADGAATAASTAQTSANTANTNALSATKRTSVIYRSMSGGSAPSAPSTWVTDVTGGQNTWTLIRPEYSSSYPALYIAQQSESVGGTYSCSTPKIDATTTVIDGSHIITGTIDASKISVNNLQAISASIAGWTLSSTLIRKLVDESVDVYMQAPVNPTSGNLAFAVRTWNSESSAWENRFYVSYGGTMFANNANISGTITATAGTIGGVTIANGVLSGISDTNIRAGGISGGSGGSIGGSTITTHNTVSGINTNLGYGAAYGLATQSGTGSYPSYFTCGYLNATSGIQFAGSTLGKTSITVSTPNGDRTIYYIGYQS